LGAPIVRAVVIFVFLFLFIVLPFRFHRHKAAIAIDIGIIAAVLFFFSETYYLAVPLIFMSVVFFQKNSILTVLYYVFITAPLEIMQYSRYIAQATRPDWWVAAGSSPPIYAPLTEIFKNLQESMNQFRLYDTSKVIYTITGQVTSNPPLDNTVSQALSQYQDSLPGIALFLVIVIGVIFAILFLANTLLPDKQATKAKKLLLILTATFATAVFFIFLGALQSPLAFRAEIDGSKMIIGTLATTILTMPILLFDLTPKQKATLEMIREKAKELMTKLQGFEELLNKVKSSIPVEVSSIEGKMLITKDKLNYILSKTTAKFFDPSDLDKIFNELDKDISTDINNLISDLDLLLRKYQIYANGEYSTWIGKFKDIELEVKVTAKTDFQKEQPLELRVDSIKEVLDGGRSFATEVIPVVEQTYNIIRALYDPNLPKESQTLVFVKQKLDEETAPWIAIDALFTSLNNWKKQYRAEISKSVKNLQNSLTYIANLSNKSEKLLLALGDDFSKLMDQAKNAEDIRISIEKKTLTIMNVTVIKDALQSSLSIAKDVLSILYEELSSKEEAIVSLLPTKGYLWEKNITLRERMASAMKIIFNPATHGLKQVMANLPKAVSYIDECVETIAIYNNRKELLLNYPIAEMIIEDFLSQNNKVSIQDLPFETKCAGEYLKLFYSEKFREFAFDDSNKLLMRREPA
jgi:hypothetical protein